jgi:carbon monoxide dehydrogenase subunit G
MPTYETSVDVAAPVATVWDVTRDVESWPSWSPTMDEVTLTAPGPLAPGVTARVRQPRLRPATWVVDRVEPEQVFVWHTSGPGFRLTADHVLAPRDGGTRVLLRLSATGPLATLVWALTGRTARRYVDEEAAALRERSEAAG